jgi:hypothetical protein
MPFYLKEDSMDVTGMLAIIFFFVTISTIVGSIIFSRHRERMTMIEKGMKAEDMKSLYERSVREWTPLTSLKWGIIFVAVGLAILLGLFLHAQYYVEGGIYPALIALFGGIGLVLFYVIANRKVRT